jgi:putative RecB family exonuclease
MNLFRNEHLSVSRLKLYEQCAFAFFARYVDPGPIEPRGSAAAFGSVLHAALELVYAWVVDNEYEGAFPVEVLGDSYRAAWLESDLVGVALYQEGLELLMTYAKSHAAVSHWGILAVEKEFNIEVGGSGSSGYVVNGYLDRVDKLADDHIAIVDYKSNRALFYEDELESDLQMSVYGLVAREFWPWAQRVSFVFHMLRHDVHQGADRTAKDIDDAAGYVVALGKRTEDASQKWTATLNTNCGYCDSRRRCPTYQAALAGKHEVARVANLADLAEVCATREQLHTLAKLMYARKAELDDVIKARLAHDGEFIANGYRYRTISQSHVTYPSVEALERVFGRVGVAPSTVRARVLAVDKDAVEALRIEATERLESAPGVMLKATIDALADRQVTPKLDSHKIKVKPAAGKRP